MADTAGFSSFNNCGYDLLQQAMLPVVDEMLLEESDFGINLLQNDLDSLNDVFVNEQQQHQQPVLTFNPAEQQTLLQQAPLQYNITDFLKDIVQTQPPQNSSDDSLQLQNESQVQQQAVDQPIQIDALDFLNANTELQKVQQNDQTCQQLINELAENGLKMNRINDNAAITPAFEKPKVYVPQEVEKVKQTPKPVQSTTSNPPCNNGQSNSVKRFGLNRPVTTRVGQYPHVFLLPTINGTLFLKKSSVPNGTTSKLDNKPKISNNKPATKYITVLSNGQKKNLLIPYKNVPAGTSILKTSVMKNNKISNLNTIALQNRIKTTPLGQEVFQVARNNLEIKNITSISAKHNKRGRPPGKKSDNVQTVAIKTEDLPEVKDVFTRSGRRSRPPAHMLDMVDYKPACSGEFSQQDSDLTASDNDKKNINNFENGFLLPGVETTKRKISPDFKCNVCFKTYLGYKKIAKHYEDFPSHGNIDQLTLADVSKKIEQDPFTKKKKIRITPMNGNLLREKKLREAMSKCEDQEIVKVAGKSVVKGLSLYELLLLKSENNAKTFFTEIQDLLNRVKIMQSSVLCKENDENTSEDSFYINSQFGNTIGITEGNYKIKEPLCEKEDRRRFSETSDELDGNLLQTLKKQKLNSEEDQSGSDTSEGTDIFSDLKFSSQIANTSVKASNDSLNSLNNSSAGYQNFSINFSEGMNPGSFTKLSESFESNNITCLKSEGIPKPVEQQKTFIKLEPTKSTLRGNIKVNVFKPISGSNFVVQRVQQVTRVHSEPITNLPRSDQKKEHKMVNITTANSINELFKQIGSNDGNKRR